MGSQLEANGCPRLRHRHLPVSAFNSASSLMCCCGHGMTNEGQRSFSERDCKRGFRSSSIRRRLKISSIVRSRLKKMDACQGYLHTIIEREKGKRAENDASQTSCTEDGQDESGPGLGHKKAGHDSRRGDSSYLMRLFQVNMKATG